MAEIYKILPEISGDELMYIAALLKDVDDETARNFALSYRAKRKDPQTVMLLTLIGFLGFAGINRFFVDQIALGIIYLLTAGFCWIGVIVDLVTYKRIAFEYNQRVAHEVKMAIGF